jgi:predicted phosphodiesterase
MGAKRRIALISDIHGNEIALSATLRSIRSRGVDEIVCLGDVATLGAAPGEVIDILQQLGCRCIMGNHDDYLLDPHLTDSHNELPHIVEAIEWCRERVTREQLKFVRGFADGLVIDLGHGNTLKLYHGSPGSNVVDLFSQTDPDTFDGLLGPERATVMAGGHTHLQMLRQHRGSLVVNPGSVGAPFMEVPRGGPPRLLPHAEYATVEAIGADVTVLLHRVALDGKALARAALASDNPMREELAANYI